MIESFKHLEQLAAGRDLADVFLETDSQEHGVPAADILEALTKRRAIVVPKRDQDANRVFVAAGKQPQHAFVVFLRRLRHPAIESEVGGKLKMT